MTPEDMSSIIAAHALQSNESSENEQQLSQIDHTDSVDGESLNIFHYTKSIFFKNIIKHSNPRNYSVNSKRKSFY